MKTTNLLPRTWIVATAMLGTPIAALAQVPPHAPGSICFTQQFWCWAAPPGQPGTACGCPSPYGRVSGQLG